ncbi:MAG: hypothetical protein AB4290_14360 [Spirulina sp.]
MAREPRSPKRTIILTFVAGSRSRPEGNFTLALMSCSITSTIYGLFLV